MSRGGGGGGMRWCASFVLAACASACQRAPAVPAGPFLEGQPLESYCRDHACPRDYDDAVAHAFAGQPNQQVYPACRGARAVALFTSDTANAWYFDGVTGELIGEEDSSWGRGGRYGRVVSLSDCKPQVEPKHFAWRTDERLARACDALDGVGDVPAGAPDTYRFRKDGSRSPVRVCAVAATDGHFVTGDGRSFRALSLPEWYGLLRAIEDAHLERPPRADPPPPVVEGDPPLDLEGTDWRIDTVVGGKRTTAVRHGPTVEHDFRGAVKAFGRLVEP